MSITNTFSIPFGESDEDARAYALRALESGTIRFLEAWRGTTPFSTDEPNSFGIQPDPEFTVTIVIHQRPQAIESDDPLPPSPPED